MRKGSRVLVRADHVAMGGVAVPMKRTGCCFKTCKDQIISVDVDNRATMARARVLRGRASAVSDRAGRMIMPDKKTIEKAREDKREGKSPSTQAGEFVRAEIDKIRHGEHGARSTQQAIAIGLSEARRAGVDLPPP